MMEDLELLREIFKDDRLHIGIGTIKQVGLSNDKGKYRCRVSLLPDVREIIAIQTFDDIGSVQLYQPGDFVLVAFVDGHPEDAFIISCLTEHDQPVPILARSGHKVVQSRAGKKLYLSSTAKIALARPGQEPTQPLVLGTVLVTLLTNLIQAFTNAPQIGTVSGIPVTLDPALAASLTSLVSTYLSSSSTNIVSQISFTERGT